VFAVRLEPVRERLWNVLVTSAAAQLAEPLLIVGDLKAGLQETDKAGKTFVCAEQFRRLGEAEYADPARGSLPVAPPATCELSKELERIRSRCSAKPWRFAKNDSGQT
jgi:hypothetical protein